METHRSPAASPPSLCLEPPLSWAPAWLSSLLQVPPPLTRFYSQLCRPACRAASSLAPAAGLVYGLGNEPEVQTAPGGSSWAGAPAWGRSPPGPRRSLCSGLGPFTSCLFAGWVPDTQAGPSGCAGLQVGSRPGQPVEVQSSRMKGDLVFYDSLVWLMESLEGLPARGPEPHSRGLALSSPGNPEAEQLLH